MTPSAKRQISVLFLFLVVASASAQELLNLNTTHRCIYSGVLEEELYSFEANASVPAMVDNILRTTGAPRNFTLVETNVESVVAVLDGDKRYILYSQDFFIKTREKAVAYGLLAHEIGHHAARHTFDDAFREKEELEADLFMGYALCKTSDIRFNAALQLPERVDFSYPIDHAARQKAIETGWRRADAYLRGKDNLAYYEDEHNNPSLPIPRFPWPPPLADQRQTLASNLTTSCRTLADVDLRLQRALEARGYSQLSYFQTPGGFAIVTQLEKISTDKTARPGSSRWTDYPVQEDFNGLWQYLQTSVMDAPGNYRLFVFIVTDAPYTQSNTRISKEDAVRWLSLGLNILPPDIGRSPVTANHRLDLLVYEFSTVRESNKIAPKNLLPKDVEEHFEKSGLKDMLREQKLIRE